MRRTGFCLMVGALLAPSALCAEEEGLPVAFAVENDGPVSAVLGIVEVTALAAEDAVPAAAQATVRVIAVAKDGKKDDDDQAIRVIIQEDGEGGPVKFQLGEGGGIAFSKFWVGLDCAAPDDAQRKQLGLEEGTGLVISTVAEDSPAKAAGLEVKDVIASAKAGDKEHKLASVPQFAQLIQQTGETPLALTVLRGGKTMTITVTPAVRPGIAQILHEREAGEKSRKSEPKRDGADRPGRGGFGPMRHGAGGGGSAQSSSGSPWRQLHRPGSFSFRMAGPVIVKLAEEHSKLPDDMKISITKSGNEPAEISVKQGDKSWTVKDTELDKLPADVKGNVQKFLGPGLMMKFGPPDFLKHMGGNPFGAGPPPWVRQGNPMTRRHHERDDDDHHGKGDDDDDDMKKVGKRHGGDKHHGGDARKKHKGHKGHKVHAGKNDCPHCAAARKGKARHAAHARHGQGGRHAMARKHHRGARHHAMARGHRHGGRHHGMTRGRMHSRFGFQHRGGFGPGMWRGPQGRFGFQPQLGRPMGGPPQSWGGFSGQPGAPAGMMRRMQPANPGPGQGWQQLAPNPAQQQEAGKRLEEMVKQLERARAQQPGGQPHSGAQPQTGAPRVLNPAPVAAPATDQLKRQLHELQEQQERLSKALRDLNEAIEKSQPKR